MEDVKYYLGMHVERDLDKGVLRLHQRKYYEGLAEKYRVQDGGKIATPLPSGFTVEPYADEEVVGESDRKLFHSMVGALNYAANHSRPDIAFATSRLASVVSRPSHEQLEAAKRLVCYVSATTSVGLEYSAVRQRLQRDAADLSKGEMLLACYTDASFNFVKADGTSIGGYVCLFGGGAVSWCSKKQNEVGMSSCETEYMALYHGVKEVAMFKGADGKMVGLKNVLWVPKLAANLITVRRLQKAGMDTSSKGAKTYTARLGERILWDLQEDRDVYNEMWKNPVVPMPKERQVAASINTKGEAFGSGDDTNGRAKEIKSKKFNLGVSSKLAEHEGSGAAAQKQHKGEENPKAAAEEEYEESMWGTIASAAFSNT
ncbi:unnamed protein product [Closterium sp. NIES-54]